MAGITLVYLGDLLRPQRRRCNREVGYTDYCRGMMVLRQNQLNKELFWGCSEFPACRHTEPFANPGDIPMSLRGGVSRKPRSYHDGDY